jgi:hypothetical protein
MPSLMRPGVVATALAAFLDLPHTLPQGGLEVDRPAVLAEQVGERLVGEFLEILHAIPREQI